MNQANRDVYARRYLAKFDGDQFAACRAACSDAENVLKSCKGALDEWEALNFAFSGTKPSLLHVRKRAKQKMNLQAPKTEYMKNLLSYVDDDSVVECVEQSFSQSVRLGSLTFYYPIKVNPGQKARARVLTRMCWHNRQGD